MRNLKAHRGAVSNSARRSQCTQAAGPPGPVGTRPGCDLYCQVPGHGDPPGLARAEPCTSNVHTCELGRRGLQTRLGRSTRISLRLRLCEPKIISRLLRLVLLPVSHAGGSVTRPFLHRTRLGPDSEAPLASVPGPYPDAVTDGPQGLGYSTLVRVGPPPVRRLGSSLWAIRTVADSATGRRMGELFTATLPFTGGFGGYKSRGLMSERENYSIE